MKELSFDVVVEATPRITEAVAREFEKKMKYKMCGIYTYKLLTRMIKYIRTKYILFDDMYITVIRG